MMFGGATLPEAPWAGCGNPQSLIDASTPDRVCQDILAAADAAGAERFAWFGYSGGGSKPPSALA